MNWIEDNHSLEQDDDDGGGGCGEDCDDEDDDDDDEGPPSFVCVSVETAWPVKCIPVSVRPPLIRYVCRLPD